MKKAERNHITYKKILYGTMNKFLLKSNKIWKSYSKILESTAFINKAYSYKIRN